MFRKVLSLFAMFAMAATLFTGLNASAESVSNAKAAELACHRIDRLVTLKKIDASFLTAFVGLKLSNLQSGDERFKVVASQSANDSTVVLYMDEAGKTLRHEVIPGIMATEHLTEVGATTTDVDPVTLTENALHYVLDNSGDVKIAKYFNSLVSTQLTKVKNAQGQEIAQVEIIATGAVVPLTIFLGLDGSFLSAE